MLLNKYMYNDRKNFYLGEKLKNNTFALDIPMHNIDYYNAGGLNPFVLKEYHDPLKQLLIKTGNVERNLIVEYGDIQHQTNALSISKNRHIKCVDGVIVRCFNFIRHWEKYYNRPKDILFQDKISKIFWRGASTGRPDFPGNRFKMLDIWFGKNENIDIGFFKICQDRAEYSKYLKDFCHPHAFLKYKYILSVEGNDKDSGLQWKLNSNSVVLMPRPKVTSWLMEHTLIADYHYVLISDEFEDLEDKLNWCKNNEQKCLDIIKNANTFMGQFSDKDKEEELELDVIRTYFNKIDDKLKIT